MILMFNAIHYCLQIHYYYCLCLKILEISALNYAFRCKQFVWMGDYLSQKLPVNGFKWVEKLSNFNERFIKSYNENSDIGCFFWKQMQSIQKQIFNLHKDLPFLPERKKLEKVKNLFLVQKTKKICYSNKCLKTSIKSWINAKKCTQSNSI